MSLKHQGQASDASRTAEIIPEKGTEQKRNNQFLKYLEEFLLGYAVTGGCVTCAATGFVTETIKKCSEGQTLRGRNKMFGCHILVLRLAL
jgi:hypothetical protein